MNASANRKSAWPILARISLLTLLCLLTILSTTSYAQDAVNASIELPPGFTVTEITGLTYPTDMAFLPGGDLLVLEKGLGDGPDGSANVRVIRDGAVREEPVLTLSTNPVGDSGLLGLAIDPDFAENGYVYIWHATGEGSPGWEGFTFNRLSRFTVDPVTAVGDPTSELVMIDDIRHFGMHNGGGLVFGGDGRLYVAIGDTTLYGSAMDLTSPLGKLFRIAPTGDGYTVPADNPFVDDPDAMDQIYGLGLRNPFRITRRQSDGRVYIGDVGGERWEEVNLAAPGANYGWARREGPCPRDEPLPCEPAPPEYTDPIVYYVHPQGLGGALTGLTFYGGSEFPEAFIDQLFIADFNQATIDLVRLDDDGFRIIPFAANVPFVVDLEYHDEKLYYLDINGGSVGVISYTGIPNRLPVAVVEADVTLGAAPLEVHVDGSASYDPDGAIVDYRWSFAGEGFPPLPSDPHLNFRFEADGYYLLSLVVVDDDGAASEAAELEIQVYSGEIPTITLTNLTEAGRSLYHGGDRWQYAAQRAGGTGDLDPERPFVWTVALHHNQHSHPVIVDQVTDSAVLEIDRDYHDGATNIWYRFHLYMNTASGQQIHVSDEVRPQIATISVAANPSPAEIAVNGVEQPTPYWYDAIAGTEHTLTAPAEVLTDRGVGVFDFWHVYAGAWPSTDALNDEPPPLTDRALTLFAPAENTTYTAFYRFDRPANKLFLPMVGR